MIESKSGKFRPKRINFAQISNTALQDKTLSLKAKGLYALIQSLITIPGIDLRIWKIRSLCKEGDKAFDGAWKELKAAGYLKQYRIPGGKKGAFKYEYDLLFEPDLKLPAVINLNKYGDIIPPKDSDDKSQTESCSGAPEADADHNPQNGGGGEKSEKAPDHTPHFGPYAKSTPCFKQSVLNGGGNSNTPSSNTPLGNTQSVSQAAEQAKPVPPEGAQTDGQTDKIRNELTKQIDFDWIAETHPEDIESAKALLNCMVEMLSASFTKINGINQSRYSLQKMLSGVVEDDIVGFLDHMHSTQPKDIRNVGAYWKSAFINYLGEQKLLLSTI